MSSRERNVRATRQRIIEACEHLFTTKGYDATSIEDIVKRASITRQTLFSQFPGKRAVVTELWLTWLEGQAVSPPSDPEVPGGVLAAIRQGIVAQARDIESRREYMALLFTESAGFALPVSDVARLRSRVAERADRIFASVATAITAGQASGEIRAELDPRHVAEVYLAAMQMAIRLWLADDSPGEPLSDRMLASVDLLENGVRAVPPAGGEPPGSPLPCRDGED